VEHLSQPPRPIHRHHPAIFFDESENPEVLSKDVPLEFSYGSLHLPAEAMLGSAMLQNRSLGRSPPSAMLASNHRPISESRKKPKVKASGSRPARACENCNAMHDGNYGSGRFCSQSCRSRFNGRKMIAAPSGKSRPRAKRDSTHQAGERKPKRTANQATMSVPIEGECNSRIAFAHNSLCQRCGFGGQLICCNFCNLVYHMECLDPPMSSAPEGLWQCPVCVSSAARQRGDRANPQANPQARYDLQRIVHGKLLLGAQTGDGQAIPLRREQLEGKRRRVVHDYSAMNQGQMGMLAGARPAGPEGYVHEKRRPTFSPLPATSGCPESLNGDVFDFRTLPVDFDPQLVSDPQVATDLEKFMIHHLQPSPGGSRLPISPALMLGSPSPLVKPPQWKHADAPVVCYNVDGDNSHSRSQAPKEEDKLSNSGENSAAIQGNDTSSSVTKCQAHSELAKPIATKPKI